MWGSLLLFALAGAVAGYRLLRERLFSTAGPGGDTLSVARMAELMTRAASRGPEQPVPFSHTFHVRFLDMACEYCHTGSRASARAGMPSLELCMGCHRVVGQNLEGVQLLRAYREEGEPVPWKRVYRLPEFVQFSHRAHLRNRIPCEECHGPVNNMPRLYRWSPLTMGWCLECHRSPPDSADVATDHHLIREFPPPRIPEGRQDRGLYPVRIDREYGRTRGPVDCFACHY